MYIHDIVCVTGFPFLNFLLLMLCVHVKGIEFWGVVEIMFNTHTDKDS